MKLKVPFVRNTKETKGKGWCGPIALASILRYYKNNSSAEDIAKLAESSNKGEGGTVPEGLIYFCLQNGFYVDYINKNKKYFYNNYSKRYAYNLKLINSKKYVNGFNKKFKKFKKYNRINKTPTIKDIERYIDNKKPVLLYFNVEIGRAS